MRLTAPRITILRVLYEHPNWHIGAETLYQHFLTENRRVNLSTCYRVLHELCKAGIVERRVLGEERSVYEFSKGSRHDHIVRDDSGDILEFREPRLDRLLEDIARERGFELMDRQLVLYVRAKSEGTNEPNPTGA